MKRSSRVLFLAMVALAARLAGAADFGAVQASLETAVGGQWKTQTIEEWTCLVPSTLPPGLDKGTYAVFLADDARSAVDQARGWMGICQAPFFFLGTNAGCAVVTYVPRDHPVSQAIVRALDLAVPDAAGD